MSVEDAATCIHHTLAGVCESMETRDLFLGTDFEEAPEQGARKRPSVLKKPPRTHIVTKKAGKSREGKLPRPSVAHPPCPRCHSTDTKFCYYNNYNINQPRFYCKTCQRHWTAGGILRNIVEGAGRRKSRSSTGGRQRSHSDGDDLTGDPAALMSQSPPTTSVPTPCVSPGSLSCPGHSFADSNTRMSISDASNSLKAREMPIDIRPQRATWPQAPDIRDAYASKGSLPSVSTECFARDPQECAGGQLLDSHATMPPNSDALSWGGLLAPCGSTSIQEEFTNSELERRMDLSASARQRATLPPLFGSRSLPHSPQMTCAPTAQMLENMKRERWLAHNLKREEHMENGSRRDAYHSYADGSPQGHGAMELPELFQRAREIRPSHRTHYSRTATGLASAAACAALDRCITDVEPLTSNGILGRSALGQLAPDAMQTATDVLLAWLGDGSAHDDVDDAWSGGNRPGELSALRSLMGDSVVRSPLRPRPCAPQDKLRASALEAGERPWATSSLDTHATTTAWPDGLRCDPWASHSHAIDRHLGREHVLDE